MSAKYDPFRVWLSTTQDVTGEHTTHVSADELRDADGTGWVVPDATHVALPLDVRTVSEAHIRVAVEAWADSFAGRDHTLGEAMRSAIAALAAALGDQAP